MVASLGGIAGIVAAGAWALVAVGLFVGLIYLWNVLQSVKMLVDGIRQETVPLLGEVRVTVSSVNKELDRVDGLMESAGRIAKTAERMGNIVENTLASPLIKVAAVGAGLSAAVKRFRKDKK